MKQIINIQLPHLHTNESLGLLLFIKEKTGEISVEADQPIIEAFEEATNAFNTAVRPDATNSFTAARKAADEETDHLCTGIRMYAEAMTYNPDAATQVIAEKAFAIIKKYGHLTRMGYKEQYPTLQAMLDELSTMPSADLTKLGLTPWLDALGNAYYNFMVITSQKVDEDAARQVGIVQASRTAAEEAYYAMVARINAGAAYMGDTAYATFIDTANALIAEYRALIASRKTRAANKKADEEPAPADPDLPVDPPPVDPDLPA